MIVPAMCLPAEAELADSLSLWTVLFEEAEREIWGGPFEPMLPWEPWMIRKIRDLLGGDEWPESRTDETTLRRLHAGAA